MRLTPLKCPVCRRNPRGTQETLPAIALFTKPNAKGRLEWDGETKVLWDGQTSDCPEDAPDDGQHWVIALCEAGHDWNAVLEQ
jgi:hypothetical protein